tara:strand:- start:180 stop:407 length:228 start_codon:yes stop_codon:yes gene_type:complete
MKIEQWIKIEEKMTGLMGWDRAIDAMCDAHREVARGKAIYELSSREDRKIIFRLRKTYSNYKEFLEISKDSSQSE